MVKSFPLNSFGTTVMSIKCDSKGEFMFLIILQQPQESETNIIPACSVSIGDKELVKQATIELARSVGLSINNVEEAV